jgi:hypothetical protein
MVESLSFTEPKPQWALVTCSDLLATGRRETRFIGPFRAQRAEKKQASPTRGHVTERNFFF